MALVKTFNTPFPTAAKTGDDLLSSFAAVSVVSGAVSTFSVSFLFSSSQYKIDISNLEQTAIGIQTFLLKKPENIALLLGWQPNSLVIKKSLESNHNLEGKDIDLLKSQSRQDIVYFQYSLVMKRPKEGNINWLKSESLRGFLTALMQSVKEINEEKKIIEMLLNFSDELRKPHYKKGANLYSLSLIAAYLDMPMDDCAIAINNINFHFSISPEYYFLTHS